MFALIRRYVVVHVAQFALNNAQTVINETRCAYGYLVLVAHPLLVVHRYERVQHVLRPLGRHIIVRESDDVRLLVRPCHGQSGCASGHSRSERLASYVDYRLRTRLEVCRRAHHHLTHTTADGVVQLAFNLRRTRFLTVAPDVRESHRTLSRQVKCERGGLILQETLNGYIDRQLTAIDRLVEELTRHLVVHVQANP